MKEIVASLSLDGLFQYAKFLQLDNIDNIDYRVYKYVVDELTA